MLKHIKNLFISHYKETKYYTNTILLIIFI